VPFDDTFFFESQGKRHSNRPRNRSSSGMSSWERDYKERVRRVQPLLTT
jgi:hypothetical protein